MSRCPNHAPKVYSDELTSLGHGRAMWIPEPLEGIEVEMGDVGFIEGAGNFRRIFNMMQGDLDYGNPPGFTPLEFPKALITRIPGYLTPATYKSSSIRDSAAGLTAKATAGSVEGGATYSYTCSKGTGALLKLNDRGDQELCTNNKLWTKYITENVDNWQIFLANGPFERSVEDLVIVRGFIKTTAWDAFAWTQNTSSRTIEVLGGAPGYGTLGGYHAVTFARDTGPEYRSWPPRDLADPEQVSSVDLGPSASVEGSQTSPSQEKARTNLRRDQTVFVSYYRIKRRAFLFWNRIELRAAAGYDDLPPPPPADSGDGAMYIGTETEGKEEWSDPLDQAFRYIFERSAADIACICDGDISCLLQGQPWPRDLYQRLTELVPQIDTINDVAVFSIEDMIIASHAHNGQAAGAVAAAVVQQPQDEDQGEQSDDVPMEDDSTGERESSTKEQEDIREGSITIGKTAQDERTLRWPHTVLMDQGRDAGAPSPLAVSKDGQLVAIGFEDSVVRVWQIETEEPRFKLRGHADNVLCTAFSPDSKLLASGSSDCTVVLWDMESGRIVSNFVAHEAEVWCLAFSPDGKTLVTGSTDASLNFWNVEALKRGAEHPFATRADQESVIQAIGFTPDSSQVISCADQVGRIWDTRTGRPLSEMEGHEGVIWVLAISHKGHRAATGSEDHTARIWSTESGAELVIIRQHRAAIWSVQFSPDDSYVVSGSYDSTVSIHHASTGECRHVLSGHNSVVHAVAYSPIGDLVASGAADGSVKIWDGKKGVQIAELKGHADKIKSMAFLPDNDSLVSTSDDGTARVWSTVDVLRICD